MTTAFYGSQNCFDFHEELSIINSMTGCWYSQPKGDLLYKSIIEGTVLFSALTVAMEIVLNRGYSYIICHFNVTLDFYHRNMYRICHELSK